MRYSENFQGLFSCQTQEKDYLKRKESPILDWKYLFHSFRTSHKLLSGVGSLFLGFDQKNKRQQNQHNSGEGCESARLVQKGYSP